MAAPVSDGIIHFRLLLCTRWTEFNKTNRKQDLNVIYKVFVFWADQKNKMAALASDWLRHFRLFFWNHRIDFNETLREALDLDVLIKVGVFQTDWN